MSAAEELLPPEISPLSGDQLLEILSALIDAKDPYTAGHSRRVAILSVATAHRMGLDDDMLRTVWAAAYLHDLGKLSVPLRVLAKNGPLTEDELHAVQLHPSVGASILERIPSVRHLSPGARYHHERWDGRGYPEGLRGDHIPLLAQLLAVTDCYDAMTSNRAYRPSLDHDTALEEIARGTGVHFGPRAAAAFLSLPRSPLPLDPGGALASPRRGRPARAAGRRAPPPGRLPVPGRIDSTTRSSSSDSPEPRTGPRRNPPIGSGARSRGRRFESLMPLMPSHTAPRPDGRSGLPGWPSARWRAGSSCARAQTGKGRPSECLQALSTTRARLAAARARPAPDLAAITERLRAHAGTEQLVVRSLGGGILELVGSATDQLDLPAVLDAFATEPGVSVVVNLVWTSRSGAL